MTTVYYHLRSKPQLKLLYERAKMLRNHNLREQRVEQELAKLELADKAREELLKHRTQKTVTKKKGIEIIGGRPIDVETTTIQVKELEPDARMIDLTYKLAGLMKSDTPKLDLNIEVIGTFDDFEVKDIQNDSQERLQKLKARKDKLKARRQIEDVDFSDVEEETF